MSRYGYTLAAIVSMDSSRCIGKDGQLPWEHSQDMLYFQGQTLGKICLLGRKTYESLPLLTGTTEHGLRGRHMVVVSTTLNVDQGPHTTVVTSLEEALARVIPALLASSQGWHPEVMVLGGEQIFQQILDDADRIYLTHFTDVATKDGDTFFPYLDHRWVRVSTRAENTDRYDRVLYNLYLRRGSPGTV